MWYRIKMWWILRDFGKQITLHTLKSTRDDLVAGKAIGLSRDFFIDGTDQWPGLARRSSKRFCKILFWRRKDNPEKIKAKIEDYNGIFNSCVKEKYISWQEGDGNDGKTGRVPWKGELYDESRGLAGLVQVAAKKFPAFWALIAWIFTTIIAIVTTYLLTKKQ